MHDKFYLNKEEIKQITSCIDAFAWKHSWDLPTDSNGYINWSSDKTFVKCLKVLEQYRNDSLKFACKCDELHKLISVVRANRAREENSCDKKEKGLLNEQT